MRSGAPADLSRPLASLPYEGRDQATSAALGAMILAPSLLRERGVRFAANANKRTKR